MQVARTHTHTPCIATSLIYPFFHVCKTRWEKHLCHSGAIHGLRATFMLPLQPRSACPSGCQHLTQFWAVPPASGLFPCVVQYPLAQPLSQALHFHPPLSPPRDPCRTSQPSSSFPAASSTSPLAFTSHLHLCPFPSRMPASHTTGPTPSL